MGRCSHRLDTDTLLYDRLSCGLTNVTDPHTSAHNGLILHRFPETEGEEQESAAIVAILRNLWHILFPSGCAGGSIG